jgi:ribulose-5-phosphate 4-epimerase/fuculose-1-phosphate aldolase
VARILAVAPDLMFASRIEATLGAAGHTVVLAGSVAESAEVDGADLVVVDLDREPAEGVVSLGVPVLGFYAHLNVETREAAEAAGVDVVVPRSRMAREMPELVARLLAT